MNTPEEHAAAVMRAPGQITVASIAGAIRAYAEEVKGSQIADDHWKLTAAYLASCHAATLEGLPKSVSKRERERFKSICRKAARLLRELETPKPAGNRVADAIARCERNGV